MIKLHYSLLSTASSRFVNVFKALLLATLIFLLHPTVKAQNNCLSFDGTNDFVSVPSLGSGLTQFTFETWFNASVLASSSGLNGIFNTNSWNIGDIHYQLNCTKVQLAVNGATIVDVSYPFVANTWYHLATTYNSSTKKIKLYVNGSLVQSVSLSTAVTANFTAAQIGAWTTQRYFSGMFDEYRIWNYERTAANIHDNMYVSMVGNESGLLVNYNFNQGTASGTNTGITTLLSSTGSNNGTLTNFALTGSTSNWITSTTQSFIANNCLNFNGSNNSVTCGAINPSKFTIEAWACPSTVTVDQAIISTLSTGSNTGCELHIGQDSYAYVTVRNGSTWTDIKSTSKLLANNWVHLAATFDGSTCLLYVNGAIVNVQSSINYNAGANTMLLGQRSSGAFNFSGNIDDVRIFNRVVTGSNVLDSMQVKLSGMEKGLLACYNFDQGIAGGANSGLTTLISLTGTYHGTLNSFSLTGTTSNWVSGIKSIPTNHVTNFTGSLVNNKMTLTWTDAVGETKPDGYYIYASKTNSFTDPVEGVQPAIDNNLSDGTGVVKVLQGVQTFNGFIGETPQTVYYFRIVPFSNPNNFIKFLVSGTIPTTQTTSAPLFYLGAAAFPTDANGQFTWGDYDNDGYLDLFAQISTNEQAQLFRNNHNTTFTLNSGFFAGAGTSIGGANWIDLDRNGFLDLTGFYSDYSRVYLNSNGSFVQNTAASYVLPNFEGDWADFNNDGHIDLMIRVGEANAIKVYRRYINSFTEQFGSTFRNCSGIVKWLDYNNDGYPDIIAAGKNPIDRKLYTTIYKNDQNGRFIEQTQIKLPGIDASSMEFADYNSDGKMDILIVGNDASDSGVLLLLKNLNGSNFSVINISNFASYYQLHCFFADFNNDGLADILAGGNNWEAGNVSKLFKNNGDGTFSEIYNQTGTGVNSIVDLNNDGNLDFIDWNKRLFQNSSTATNSSPSKITNATATVEGNGVRFSWNGTDDKTPSASLTYNLRIGSAAGYGNIVMANAINTGALKVLSPGNMGTNTSVFFQLPKGTYYWNVQAIDNSFKGGPFVDADKTLTIGDIAASKLQATILDNYSLKLKWNSGNGTRRAVFCKIGTSGTASPVNGKTYVGSPSYSYGDQIGTSGWYCVYNGNSDSVIVDNLSLSYSFIFHVIEYFGSNGSESYMTTTGAGNPGVFNTAQFSLQPNLPSVSCNGNGTTAQFVDYNGDGYLDIAYYAKSPLVGNYFRIFKNKYDNTFEEQSITLPQYSYGAVSWADFNNNDTLDFVVMGKDPNDGNNLKAKLYKNNKGTFILKQDFDGLRDGSFSWCDYNNDGNIDLLISGQTGQGLNDPSYTRLYKNSGAPNYNFTEQTDILLLGLDLGVSKWGDYNNDGWPDLLMAGNANDGIYYIVLYENDKHGGFLEGKTLLQRTNSYENTNIEWSDLNKDGNLDFVWSVSPFNNFYSSGEAIIFYNNGDYTFTQDETALALQKEWNSFGISDANNDGNPDIVFSGGPQNVSFKTLYHNDYPLKSFSIDQSFSFEYSNNGSLTWGDYDNDGDMDILAPAQHHETDGTNNVNIIRNNLISKAGTFSDTAILSAPQNITTTLKPNQLLVKWDRIVQDNSSTYSYNVMLTRVSPTKQLLNSPNSDTLTGRRLLSETGNAGLNNFMVFNYLAPGTYQVKVQSIDGTFRGSTWSAPITVTVKNLQAFFNFNEVCRGFETQFNDQSTSSGTMTWLWKFDNDTTSTEQNPKHIFKTSGSHPVWLVVTSTDLQGNEGVSVKDSLLKTVYVKPRPKASYTAPNVCQETETVFSNTTDMDGIKAQSWNWDYGNGETSTDSIPLNKTFGVAKTYQSKLIVVATNDCADTAKVNTIVAPLPSATITISQNSKFSICNGSNDGANLSLTPQDNCSYRWNNHSFELTGKTDNSLTIDGSYIVGSYSITATVINNLVLSGCQSTTATPIVITVSEQPVKPKILTSTNNFCPGTEVELKIDNYSSTLNYQWKRSGVPIDGANQQFFSGKLKEGDYSVEVEPNSCSSESDILTLTTKPAPPKPNIIAWGPTVWILVCDYTTAKDYRWYYNDNLIVGAKTNQYVAKQNFGSYYVEVNDGGECYTESDIKVIPDGANGIADELFSELITTYPNPTEGNININLGNTLPGELKFELVNSLGVIQKSFTVNNSSEFSTNINGLPSGLYYCKLYYKKSVVIKKIVKL